MKLCIGTVQFGMDYGVQGGSRPSLDDAVAMLDYATQNGVDAIDTAASYGTAEEVVGEFLSRRTVPRDAIQVITKFGTGIFDGSDAAGYPQRLKDAAEKSLRRLRTDYLDAFICHVPSAAGDEAVASAMEVLKASGLVRHVGFSIYETEEAMACLASGAVDFMQAPFSVLDQRMKSSGVLGKAESKGVDVHTRSAFVQGLMLMDVDAIPAHLEATKPHVAALESLCRENGITRRVLALAFVKAQSGISHLVFGVDNMAQLREIVDDFARDIPAETVEGITSRFASVPADVFMPNKWRK
jgi:aryl-alcohol dehydrogenase-like predicted oxidoreductase